MRAASYKRIAVAASAIAVAAHALGLAMPAGTTLGAADPEYYRGAILVMALPVLLTIESLAVLGAFTYLLTTLRSPSLKRQTQVGVFTGSLALALTIPALLVPVGVARSGAGHFLFSATRSHFIETASAAANPQAGYWIWVASLTLIGIAIHLVTIARWKSAVASRGESLSA
jgi:hypothetical protein